MYEVITDIEDSLLLHEMCLFCFSVHVFLFLQHEHDFRMGSE